MLKAHGTTHRIFLALFSLAGVLPPSSCGMMGLEKDGIVDARMSAEELTGAGDGSCSPISSSSASSGQEAFSTSVYLVTRQTCVACHGSSQSPQFAIGVLSQAYQTSKALVSFTTPATSRLYFKSRDGHCGSGCSGTGSAMLTAIQSWAQGETAAANSGTATTSCPTTPSATSPTTEGNTAPAAPVPLQPVTPTQCKSLTVFQTKVRPVLATKCFGCHATQTDFNMPTADDGKLCTNALSHINRVDPILSPMIQKPLNHNGHPNVGLTTADVDPNWIDWIKVE